tara:strand:- start:2703 stop:5093 length:2391 start_codon:yes stop_codon:yes gene_type:complete
MDDKLLVCMFYRNTNYYDSFNDFLSTFELGGAEIRLYNFTTETLDISNIANIIMNEGLVQDIPGIISKYQSYCYNKYFCVLDSAVKYPKNINITKQNTYGIVRLKDIEWNFAIIEHISELSECPFLNTHSTVGHIGIPVDIDKLFVDGIVFCSNIVQYLLSYILDTSKPEELPESYYSCLFAGLKDRSPDTILESYSYSTPNWEGIAYIVQFEPILFAEKILAIIDTIHIQQSPFIFHSISKSNINKFTVNTMLERPVFSLNMVSSYNTDNIPGTYQYYPNILDNTPPRILDNFDIHIHEDIVEYTTNATSLNGVVFADKVVACRENGEFIQSVEPFVICKIDDGQLTTVFTQSLSKYFVEGDYRLSRNMIHVQGTFVSFVQAPNKSYRLVILNPDYTLLEVSLNFTTPFHLVGLIQTQNVLSFISYDSDKVFYAHPVSSLTLCTKISKVLSYGPSDIIYNRIDMKSVVHLKISGAVLTKVRMGPYTFNYEYPDALIVEFYPVSNLIISENQMSHINTYVYIQTDIKLLEKTHTLCFHESAIESRFYNFINKTDVSVSDTYCNAQYLVISQEAIEHLNSLEISNIINNNCLIISLLSSASLENDYIKRSITTCDALIKIYLFNIVENTDHSAFILDNIINKNLYSERSSLFKLEQARLLRGHSIYNAIHTHIKSSCGVNFTLSSKGNEMYKNALGHVNLDEMSDNYKQLIRYIIKHNMEVEVHYLNRTLKDKYSTLDKISWIESVIGADFDTFKLNTEAIIIVSKMEDIVNSKFDIDGLIFVDSVDYIVQLKKTGT